MRLSVQMFDTAYTATQSAMAKNERQVLRTTSTQLTEKQVSLASSYNALISLSRRPRHTYTTGDYSDDDDDDSDNLL